MFEKDQPDRPIDPPRPVWVRQPAVGRQRQDMGVEGLLHAWVRVFEWDTWVWAARVSTTDPEHTTLVSPTGVLPRDT